MTAQQQGMAPPKTRNAKTDHLLTPENATLILIDYQPEMFFGVGSMDRTLLLNNVVGLAEAAKLFGLPVVLSTVGASRSGEGGAAQSAESLSGRPAVQP